MAVPIPCMTNIFCAVPREPEAFCEGRCLVDALIFITTLVVGILGLTGVINMPPAAGFTLIGISAAYIPLWIVMIVVRKTIPAAGSE
jgi:hypothetical protein